MTALHLLTDEQLGNEIGLLISDRVESASPPAGVFLAIQDRLGSQDIDWSLSRLIGRLLPGEWRLPMFTGMIMKVTAAIVVAIAIVAVVVFQGDDGDDAGTQQAAEPTATTPAVPEATPIGKLTIPDDLVPFDDMGGVAGSPWWHAGEMRAPLNVSRGGSVSRLGPNASDEAVASWLAQELEQKGFGRRRWQLLTYAPGIDPMADGHVYVADLDLPPVIGANTGDFTLSADDPRVINVEEFAFCDDGRGVYLQHSEKPAEIGETFAWDVYALPGEANDGIFHLVLTAEPNSAITYDGPDPKKIDIKITAVGGVMTSEIVEADIKMVGMLSNDPAILEMCAN